MLSPQLRGRNCQSALDASLFVEASAQVIEARLIGVWTTLLCIIVWHTVLFTLLIAVAFVETRGAGLHVRIPAAVVALEGILGVR